jgi:hypothetical protein
LKTKFQILLFLFFCFATAVRSYGQTNPILGSFSANDNNGEVYLSWSIVAGSTCNGISILRAGDGIDFKEIGNIAGVCGSSSSEVNYSFTDTNPLKNAVNYYRLELGFSNFSQIISIEIIDIESNGYQVRPNPSTDFSTIYFENSKRQEYQFELHNLAGMQVMSSLTKDDFIQVNSSILGSGVYFFKISLPANLPKVKGKMMVE